MFKAAFEEGLKSMGNNIFVGMEGIAWTSDMRGTAVNRENNWFLELSSDLQDKSVLFYTRDR